MNVCQGTLLVIKYVIVFHFSWDNKGYLCFQTEPISGVCNMIHTRNFHLGIYLNQHTLNLWNKLSRPFIENVKRLCLQDGGWSITWIASIDKWTRGIHEILDPEYRQIMTLWVNWPKNSGEFDSFFGTIDHSLQEQNYPVFESADFEILVVVNLYRPTFKANS